MIPTEKAAQGILMSCAPAIAVSLLAEMGPENAACSVSQLDPLMTAPY